MRILVAILLLIHGLITMAQSGTGFSSSGGAANPRWLNWWPTNLGQSWLIKVGGTPKPLFGTLTGMFWIAAGLCLVAAALGLLGVIIPTHLWRVLAGIGAVLSLVVFVFYAHPLYAAGIAANLAILLILLWMKWPSIAQLGS